MVSCYSGGGVTCVPQKDTSVSEPPGPVTVTFLGHKV